MATIPQLSEQIDFTASPHYRTAFHFQPPKNWINDPNGPMYYNDIYHLFYQYNPNDAVWGNIVWGHAVSKDLVNWSILTPAISPDKPYDSSGCWSGSATIIQGNTPVIIYTGGDEHGRQVQNLAFPADITDPYLTHWIKPDYNPVIEPTAAINPHEFRDPTTGWLGADGYWRLLIGAAMVDGTVKPLLYKSSDFITWEEAPRTICSIEGTGTWECLDFFPVLKDGKEEAVDTSVNGADVKHVFKLGIVSKNTDHYILGKYLEEDILVPDGEHAEKGVDLRYDYGVFYASKVFFDAAKKRRIVWAWVKELDREEDSVARGWAGIQTIPRALWLDKSGKQLLQWPVEEFKSLRRHAVKLLNKDIDFGAHVEVNGVNAAQADVEVDFNLQNLDKAEQLDPIWLDDPEKLSIQKGPFVPGGVGPFGLLVLASDSLDEYTAVFFRIFKTRDKYVTLMCSDQSRSSLQPEVSKPSYAAFVDIDIESTRKISLRTLIDHSAVESFGAKGKVCITARVYPTALASGNTHLFVFNSGSAAVTANLEAWEMAKAHIE